MPTTYNNGKGKTYGKVVLDVDESMARNERDAARSAFPAWQVSEIGIVNTFLKFRPCRHDEDRRCMRVAQATKCSDLKFWRKDDRLDESRPIVIIDKKGRLAAIGWPQVNHTFVIERMAGNLIMCHEQKNSIVSPGMWAMLMTVAEVNGGDAWGRAPGMSVTAMFHGCHHASIAEREQKMSGSAGARAA